MKKAGWGRLVEKFLANIDDFKREENWFAAKIFMKTAKWIERNRNYNGRIFLWVNSFDPHKPWFPPREYIQRYLDPDTKPLSILPMGGEAKN